MVARFYAMGAGILGNMGNEVMQKAGASYIHEAKEEIAVTSSEQLASETVQRTGQ
jgi:hypothetical protein